MNEPTQTPGKRRRRGAASPPAPVREAALSQLSEAPVEPAPAATPGHDIVLPPPLQPKTGAKTRSAASQDGEKAKPARKSRKRDGTNKPGAAKTARDARRADVPAATNGTSPPAQAFVARMSPAVEDRSGFAPTDDTATGTDTGEVMAVGNAAYPREAHGESFSGHSHADDSAMSGHAFGEGTAIEAQGDAHHAGDDPSHDDGSIDDGGDDGGSVCAPPQQQHEPAHHRWVYAALAAFVLALGFGAWGVWTTWFAGGGKAENLADLRRQHEQLTQQVSTLQRSDQISREANRDLQRTLAERDEEISALRADVAFYERFVGATGQRRGLSVHGLEMAPQNGGVWHFVATLTQNLNRGAVNNGRLTLSIEGTRQDKLERLSWSTLRKQNNSPGLGYSFKYFQQLEGEVMLPAEFKPLRVTVRLVPQGAAPVEQSFPWPETLDRRASEG